MAWTQMALLTGLGFLVGAVGTLIGAGGGFILVPVLLFLYPDLKPEVITSISLGVVFLNASSGSLAYAKMRRIDYKSAGIFALATLPGAILGAFMTSFIKRGVFNWLLGAFLILIALFLLLRPHYRKVTSSEYKGGHVHRHVVDNRGHEYTYSFNVWTGVILSFFVGYLSSLLGIGGGIIHVPALTALLNFPVHVATATSHFILAVMALAGTIVHIYQGNLKDVWLNTVCIGVGVIGGAQVGAYYSHFLKPEWIVRALAIALLLVGLRLLL